MEIDRAIDGVSDSATKAFLKAFLVQRDLSMFLDEQNNKADSMRESRSAELDLPWASQVLRHRNWMGIGS